LTFLKSFNFKRLKYWHDISITRISELKDIGNGNEMIVDMLEIIELRTSPGNVEIAETFLREWASAQKTAFWTTRYYKHITLETDFSIHISYPPGKTSMRQVSEVKQLADSLKDYGLVSHNVWTQRL
jgi:hypothetical protein